MKLPGIWGCQNGGNWLRAAKLVAGSAVAMSFGLRPTGLIGEIWGLATEEIQALRDTFEETLEELGVTLVVLIDDLDRWLMVPTMLPRKVEMHQ